MCIHTYISRWRDDGGEMMDNGKNEKFLVVTGTRMVHHVFLCKWWENLFLKLLTF